MSPRLADNSHRRGNPGPRLVRHRIPVRRSDAACLLQPHVGQCWHYEFSYFILLFSCHCRLSHPPQTMSSSIAIPATPAATTVFRGSGSSSKSAASSSSSYSSSLQVGISPSNHKHKMGHGRRPSLLSTALSKQECTVINIGDPDEIFLPPYIDCDYVPLENQRDPVHDIVLSEEESKSMLPQ
ncbi:hypothetical protein SODALDRAFT_362658 [Sodiomyces alkalinus F11]|uniref:Uncharacterized protein n=1 Tax=Sodiomyces alkalinus (strain CBS 110278 / VKM F-3762 / F11) TaxID=1314773 RepID=A0A3N2PMR3_SODAK|nr:hypothetical protein SODALDRAFT_362658 [Sodiomyces alkalinus F11]ROT35818.1 hypothetical protein SODALDRAFT_362658 [Sodiomyces alkalinus F11]